MRLYIRNWRINWIRGREDISPRFKFGLYFNPRVSQCATVTPRAIGIGISSISLDIARRVRYSSREAASNKKRRETTAISRLLRASTNILIPDARDARRGSFLKMLPVLRASDICIILRGICERYAPGIYTDGTAIARKQRSDRISGEGLAYTLKWSRLWEI